MKNLSQSIHGKYVHWFKLAKQVLDSKLPNITESDMKKWVTNTDWAILPIEGENSLKNAINRPYPHIAFEVGDEIFIHLTCNTVKSIGRMQNILEAFHDPEKEKFLAALHNLDDSFRTTVSTKIKDYHFSQPPEYTRDFTKKSNKMTADDFVRVFDLARNIRERGLSRRAKEGKSWSVESAAISLARSTFRVDGRLFKKKLAQLSPLYEVALSIRSNAQIERLSHRDTPSIKGQRTSADIELLRCPNGHKSWPAIVTKRCPECKAEGIAP